MNSVRPDNRNSDSTSSPGVYSIQEVVRIPLTFTPHNGVIRRAIHTKVHL